MHFVISQPDLQKLLWDWLTWLSILYKFQKILRADLRMVFHVRFQCMFSFSSQGVPFPDFVKTPMGRRRRVLPRQGTSCTRVDAPSTPAALANTTFPTTVAPQQDFVSGIEIIPLVPHRDATVWNESCCPLLLRCQKSGSSSKPLLKDCFWSLHTSRRLCQLWRTANFFGGGFGLCALFCYSYSFCLWLCFRLCLGFGTSAHT